MMRRHGLRSEIVVTLSILLGSALLLGGFVLLRFAEQRLLQQRIQEIRSSVRLVANILAEPDGQQTEFHTERLKQLQDELDAEGWWVHDRDLQLLASFTRGSDRPLGKARLRQLLLDRSEFVEANWPGLLALPQAREASAVTVAEPIQVRGRMVGIFSARVSLVPLLRELELAQVWLLGYSLAFGLVLVAAGLFLLNRNVVQPTRNLLQATQNVTAGDLTSTLESSGPREIAELAESFNEMILALQASHRETESHIVSLQQANAALQQVQNELVRSEKLATVGHLAAGMAHEIGNPLGALTGYLALLGKDVAGTSQAEVVAHAASEAERIDRLVRELLDYSAPGKAFLELVDPWEVLRDAVRMLDLQGALKGCEIIFDDQLQLPPIRMDRHKLTQVFVNLLLNSKDAADDQPQISLRASDAGDAVEIRLQDNGCGIPAEHLDLVFEPFYTTKAPGKGRGLGLAICQRIVTEAGGDIRCESVPGDGCTFILTFPKAAEHE